MVRRFLCSVAAGMLLATAAFPPGAVAETQALPPPTPQETGHLTATAAGQARILQFRGTILFSQGGFNDLQAGADSATVIGVTQSAGDNRTGTQLLAGSNMSGDARYEDEGGGRGLLIVANMIQHSQFNNVIAGGTAGMSMTFAGHQFAGVNVISAEGPGIEAHN